ncbi:NmrA family NAD(P)-binding protein, partial [Streptomyces sp. SID11233]|nr:NmrA family NAD(P)-binding protein [Streptomyces sp. SID11233]
AKETLVADLLEPARRREAMAGVETVVHIGPLFHHREAEIGHAVVAEARRAGVGHFVQFSVVHPQIEALLNHQAKLAVERFVLQSPVPFTILQPMHYLQNI